MVAPGGSPCSSGFRCSTTQTLLVAVHRSRTRSSSRRRTSLPAGSAAAHSLSFAMTPHKDSGGMRALSIETAESREWLRAYARGVLRERFRQKAIYLKFVGPVEHLIVSEEEISDEE